jgi:hypothetical protein
VTPAATTSERHEAAHEVVGSRRPWFGLEEIVVGKVEADRRRREQDEHALPLDCLRQSSEDGLTSRYLSCG